MPHRVTFLNWNKEKNKHWENCIATYKTMKLEHYITSYTKIISKWIKDLNIRPETLKLLEDNTGRRLFEIIQSKNFFGPVS